MAQQEPDEEEFFHPDMKDAVGGLFCFLNADRVCGPECMAYSTYPKEQKGGLSAQQSHCVLLSSAEGAYRHLVVIAGSLNQAEKRRRTERQDKEREQALGPVPNPIPKPGGIF